MEAHKGELLLIMESGPHKGKIYPLERETITLGREVDNTITLDDPRISRHHARLQLLPTGTVLIEDLGSMNGTFIEGEAVKEPSQLFPGEAFMIADCARFRLIATESIPQPETYCAQPTEVSVSSPKIEQDARPQAVRDTIYTTAEDIPASEIDTQGGRPSPRWLYVLIGGLALLTCLCLALTIYLWFAPSAFLIRILELLKFPKPTL